MNILNQNQLISAGTINFSKKVNDTIRNEIADKFVFLAERKQVDFLSKLLNEKDRTELANHISAGEFYTVRYDIQNKFSDVNVTVKNRPYETNRLVLVREKQAVELGNYQYLISFYRYSRDPQTLNEDEFELKDQLTNKSSLKLILNSEQEVDFGPQIIRLFEENKNKTGNVKIPEIAMESDLGKYHVKLIFNEITREKYSEQDAASIYYENVYILIRLK